MLFIQTVKQESDFETQRSLVKAAFQQAAKEGTQPENMMKRAKEIAGDAVQDVGEELTKRFLCFGFCIAAAVAAVGTITASQVSAGAAVVAAGATVYSAGKK
jgi:histone H3/H4